MQLAPGVFRFQRSVWNWYVLEAEGRLVVVDAGFSSNWGNLLRGLGEIDRSLSDVSALLLTHVHADHLGFAERLREETGATVFVHADDEEGALRPDPRPPLGLRRNPQRRFVRRLLREALLQGGLRTRAIREVRSFQDGETLACPGRPVALHTPGHTPGETCFWFEDRRLLFTGDAIITMDLMTGRMTRPLIASPGLNADDEQARSSLARLDGLGDVIALPGHGEPWFGAIEAITSSAVR